MVNNIHIVLAGQHPTLVGFCSAIPGNVSENEPLS